MSPQQAAALLQGTPSRIDKELDAQKALHLLAKISACGAAGNVVPVRKHQKTPPVKQPELDGPEDADLELQPVEEAETASQAGMSLELSLVDEPESPVRETIGDEGVGLQDSVTEHAGELKLGLEPEPEPEGDERAIEERLDAATIETVVLETSPLPEERITRRTRDTGMGDDGHPGQVYEQPRITTSRPETEQKKQGMDRRLLAVAGLIVLVAAGWGGMQWFGVDEKPLAVDSSSPEVESRPQIPVDPELAITRKRLDQLFSSVGVWMIQYGSGFDPSQVTLERMRRDLQIEAEELLDGWGTPFQYRVDDGSYTVVSAGSDRQFNSDDDLRKEKRATR